MGVEMRYQAIAADSDVIELARADQSNGWCLESLMHFMTDEPRKLRRGLEYGLEKSHEPVRLPIAERAEERWDAIVETFAELRWFYIEVTQHGEGVLGCRD